MCKNEFGLQVQLNGDVLSIVLRLPPGLRVFVQIARRASNDLIDRVRFIRHFHVANIATDVFQIADETVAFGSTKTARRTGVEIRRSANE